VGPPPSTRTVDPRWGKVGQAEDRRRWQLCRSAWKPFDDEIRDLALKFIDKAKADNKPFFLCSTHAHAHRHAPVAEVSAMRQLEERLVIHEAAWRSLTTTSGLVMQKLKDMGMDDNTIVVFTTDNSTRSLPGRMVDRHRSRRQWARSMEAASACRR